MTDEQATEPNNAHAVSQGIPETSEDIGKLALAMSKAQGAIEGAAKASENPFFKSRYADLSQVWDACRDPLSKNEIAVIQMPGRKESAVILTTYLIHSSGQWMRCVFGAMPMKQDAQAVGSVTTYLRRYSLAAMVGVAQKDDDGEAAVARSKSQMDSKPVDYQKVTRVSAEITALIDGEYIDKEEYGPQKATVLRNQLTNDERIMATEKLKDKKPEGSNRSYASVFKEVLKAEKEYKNQQPAY